MLPVYAFDLGLGMPSLTTRVLDPTCHSDGVSRHHMTREEPSPAICFNTVMNCCGLHQGVPVSYWEGPLTPDPHTTMASCSPFTQRGMTDRSRRTIPCLMSPSNFLTNHTWPKNNSSSACPDFSS